MKKTFVKLMSLLTAAVILIGYLPVLAFAASPTLWASPAGKAPDAEQPISAVKWWYDDADATYYLFMPSDGDLSRMQVWFEGAETCAIDGINVANGALTDLLTAADHTVNLDGTAYPVRVMKSANIGSLYITTESGSMTAIDSDPDHKTKESGAIKYVNEKGDVIYDGKLDEIKGRGNATWKRAKKPYQFKLPKKQDLIGAGSHKTWILLANYLERTFVRNKVAYDLANDAGLTNSAESTYVDLYCNGEYRGTYQLCEKVQIGDNRIEINDLEGETEDVNTEDLDSYPTFGDKTANGKTPGTIKGFEIPNNPEDITGGYLLELDYDYRYATEISGFVTDRGKAVTINEPEAASREQVEYISTFFQEFEDAVFAPDGINPTTGKRYDEYFDMTSLARKYIIEEFTRNIDADKTSQYFYKPSDSESTVGFCGPVWDYDNAMGNYGAANLDPEGLKVAESGYIFEELYRHEDFLNAVRAEWETNFVPLIEMCVGDAEPSDDTMLRPLSEYFELLTPSAAMNFTYWENLDMVDGDAYNDTGSTFEEHYEFLDDFLTRRMAYLNTIWSTGDIQSMSISSGTKTDGITNILDYTPGLSTYIVDSEEGLQKAADLVTGGNSLSGVTLLQTADITLTKDFTPGGYTDPNGKDFEPADHSSQTFSGTYNGQGYKIYNLHIDLPENNAVAIFASAKNATFIDMHIATGAVTGYNRAGAIAGYGDTCTFIRCSNGATVHTDGGVDGAGGLAGVSRSKAVFISCFNTGSISGAVAGGLSGWGNNNITMTNCFNTGMVTATKTGANSTAALARNGVSATLDFSTCFYLSGTGNETNGATAISAAALTDGTLLNGLNAGSAVWEAGADHPVLKVPERNELVRLSTRTYAQNQLVEANVYYYIRDEQVVLSHGNDAFIEKLVLNNKECTEKTATLTADGTLDIYLNIGGKSIAAYDGTGTYYISTAEELQTFLTLTEKEDLAGSTIYIVADIDAAAITTGGLFSGTLNGKFSRLRGLKVPLFTEVGATGDVRKLILSDGNVSGNGVIAGVNNGRISYITTENIALTGDAPGGITGTNNGWINGCSTSGYILSGAMAGGIAFRNEGTIQNSVNHARIVAPGGVAGGIAAASAGTLQNCINRGMLNGKTNYAITDGAATDCYYWDWCVGEGEANAVSSAALAEEDFAENLPALYWTAGKNAPAPIAVDYELGDANGDDKVSIADAVLLLRYLNNVVTEDEVNLVAADVTGDGFFITDVVRIMQYIINAYTF